MGRVAMHTYRALECSSPGPQRQCHESDVVLLLWQVVSVWGFHTEGDAVLTPISMAHSKSRNKRIHLGAVFDVLVDAANKPCLTIGPNPVPHAARKCGVSGDVMWCGGQLRTRRWGSTMPIFQPGSR